LSFRLVAGDWILAAFILVQAYNSTLFTYLVTPIKNPLINSPYDIPERKDVHLLIRKGGSTDNFLSASSGNHINRNEKRNLISIFSAWQTEYQSQ
jgi:ionotropic glutamate receptor